MNTINVYAHRNGHSWEEIERAAKNGNGLQSFFNFRLSELSEGLSGRYQRVALRDLETVVSGLPSTVKGLIFCEETFENKPLVNEVLPMRIYASCRVSRGIKAAPFRLYLLYQMAAAALTLAARLEVGANEEMIHRPPVGCLWDWWTNQEQRGAAMITARICPECQNALRIHGGLDQASLRAAQQILDYVRRTMMGDAPDVANRIFVAYGHGDDWHVLREILTECGLEVEFFNRESVAGMQVADRWREMLNRARFAFAIMTPDDQLADGRKQARQNVVHEIGLCHGRIGLQNTAILLAEGTEPFSNVGGVNHISFVSGSLRDKVDEIKKLLTDRGIL